MDGDGGENLAAPKGTHHPSPGIEVATSLKREKFEEIIRSSVRRIRLPVELN